MTPTPITSVEIAPRGTGEAEACDLLVAADGTPCPRPAAFELLVAFPCGGSQRRVACDMHRRWIRRGYLSHADHEGDLTDRARVVAIVPLGGAA